MTAMTKQLCERMATATGRALVWKQPQVGGRRSSLEPSNHSPLAGRVQGTGRGRVGSKKYEFFISYFREEGGAHARLLQSVLEASLGRGSVFLDAADLADMSSIRSRIAHSEAVLLVLTAKVLESPWVLMEVYTAVRLRLPVLCVHIGGGGYDFAAASSYLGNLASELFSRDPGALTELRAQLAASGRGRVADLQRILASTIPSVIAVPFDPATSDEQHLMQGFADEVIQRKARLIVQQPKHTVRWPTHTVKPVHAVKWLSSKSSTRTLMVQDTGSKSSTRTLMVDAPGSSEMSACDNALGSVVEQSCTQPTEAV